MVIVTTLDKRYERWNMGVAKTWALSLGSGWVGSNRSISEKSSATVGCANSHFTRNDILVE